MSNIEAGPGGEWPQPQTKEAKVTWLAQLGPLLLGAVLLTAGATKLLQPRQFRRSVSGYSRFHPKVRRIAFWTVPPVEMGVGVWLILGGAPMLAGTAALLLIGALTFAVTVQRPTSSCGCLPGVSSSRLAQHLSINGLLALLAVTAFLDPNFTAATGGYLLVKGGTFALAIGLAAWRALGDLRARGLPGIWVWVFARYHARSALWVADEVLVIQTKQREVTGDEL